MYKRILLMYITKVSGHRQASLAIQRALRQIDDKVQVPMINGFRYTYPIWENIVHQTYMRVIKATPKIWDYLYDNPKIFKGSGAIKQYFYKTSVKKIDKLFKRYKPETIVCTQAFPCGMAAYYKKKMNVDIKVVGVLTDFAPHAYWVNEGVDYYVVPSVEAKERFMAKGVCEDAIKVYGIPLQPKFAFQLEKQPIYDRLNLSPNKPVLLIMGGGHGLGPMKNIMKSLLKIPLDFQVIVLAGKNKKRAEEIRKLARKSDKKILVYEFVRNVDEFMEIASLIVTKPGGITTAECLTKGLPMVIIDPIPGQETRNTDFLIKKGIAIRINDKEDVEEEIDFLLKSPERLAAMSRAAYEYAKPHAALDVAKLVLGQSPA